MLHGKLYLLLLSPEIPDFTRFISELCSKEAAGETKDYDGLLLRIQEGQRWRFRIRGNTTHSKSEEEGKRGKVYPHVSVKYKREWLMKKAPACGFALDDELFEITHTDQLKFMRGEKGAPVVLTVAVFEGVLRITDVELFRKALVQGIGRAKAYGCGLLTISGIKM